MSVIRNLEANPELTSVIDAEHKELEELWQNDSQECEIQAKQEKETAERELASIKEKLVEAEETVRGKRQWETKPRAEEETCWIN